MTLALLWKELRSVALIVGILCLLTLVFGIVISWIALGEGERVSVVEMGAGILLVVYPFEAGLILGAGAFATERMQQTDQFLDSLPVTRSVVGLSKAILGMALVVLPGTTGLLLVTDGPEKLLEFLPVVHSQLTCYGLGFLASTLSQSPMRGFFLSLVLAAILAPFAALGVYYFAAVCWASQQGHLLQVWSIGLLYGGLLLSAILFLAIPLLAEKKGSSRSSWILISACLAAGSLLLALPPVWWASSPELPGRAPLAAYETVARFRAVTSWLPLAWTLLLILAGLVVYVRRWPVGGRGGLTSAIAAFSIVVGGILLLLSGAA